MYDYTDKCQSIKQHKLYIISRVQLRIQVQKMSLDMFVIMLSIVNYICVIVYCYYDWGPGYSVCSSE